MTDEKKWPPGTVEVTPRGVVLHSDVSSAYPVEVTGKELTPEMIRTYAPPGYKGVYEKEAREPARPEVLSDVLALVGYAVLPETVAGWSLLRRVQAMAWAAAMHAKASDNIVRKHPRPEWLPEPWAGPEDRGVWGGSGLTRIGEWKERCTLD